jgi:hypothetical protein
MVLGDDYGMRSAFDTTDELLTEASRMLERYFYFPKEVLCENMD